MSQQAFDAAGFVNFDLETGRITSRNDDRMALLPMELVSHMTPSDGLDAAARAWGANSARKISQLASTDESLGMEPLVQHLGGSLAVAGLGRISVELWGDALLFRVDANLSDTVKAMLKGFLSGFLGTLAAGSAFEIISLHGAGEGELFWAGNPAAAAKIRTWTDEGKDAAEALDLLTRKGR